MKKFIYIMVIILICSLIYWKLSRLNTSVPTHPADISKKIVYIDVENSLIELVKDTSERTDWSIYEGLIKVTKSTKIFSSNGERTNFDKLRGGERGDIWLSSKKLRDKDDSLYSVAETILISESDKDYGYAPGDFNFVLQYGTDAKNKIDTFSGLYTKDLISAGTITTTLILTKPEMQEIYEKMMEVDIWNRSGEYDPDSRWSSNKPFSTYVLKVQINGRIKDIYFYDKKVYKFDENDEKLWDLMNFIKTIIHFRKEYRKLPEPRGLYA